MRFHLKPFFATNVASGQDLISPVAPGITCELVGDCCMCALLSPDTALDIVSLFLTIYALLRALALPTNRLTHLLASAELWLLRYAHDTSSISAIAGVFHPCAFRRNIWARSLVLCGTLLATRNSSNVRSSDSVKTIRMGAGIRKIVSVQKTYPFYLTFYCSRLLTIN